MRLGITEWNALLDRFHARAWRIWIAPAFQQSSLFGNSYEMFRIKSRRDASMMWVAVMGLEISGCSFVTAWSGNKFWICHHVVLELNLKLMTFTEITPANGISEILSLMSRDLASRCDHLRIPSCQSHCHVQREWKIVRNKPKIASWPEFVNRKTLMMICGSGNKGKWVLGPQPQTEVLNNHYFSAAARNSLIFCPIDMNSRI